MKALCLVLICIGMYSLLIGAAYYPIAYFCANITEFLFIIIFSFIAFILLVIIKRVYSFFNKNELLNSIDRYLKELENASGDEVYRQIADYVRKNWIFLSDKKYKGIFGKIRAQYHLSLMKYIKEEEDYNARIIHTNYIYSRIADSITDIEIQDLHLLRKKMRDLTFYVQLRKIIKNNNITLKKLHKDLDLDDDEFALLMSRKNVIPLRHTLYQIIISTNSTYAQATRLVDCTFTPWSEYLLDDVLFQFYLLNKNCNFAHFEFVFVFLHRYKFKQ